MEKEEFKKCTIVAFKANYFSQDYHMYARTRKTNRYRDQINITHVVIISDSCVNRFLLKQDPENCKSQRDSCKPGNQFQR